MTAIDCSSTAVPMAAGPAVQTRIDQLAVAAGRCHGRIWSGGGFESHQILAPLHQVLALCGLCILCVLAIATVFQHSLATYCADQGGVPGRQATRFLLHPFPTSRGITAAQLQLFHVDLGALRDDVTLTPHILGRVLRPSPVEAQIRQGGKGPRE